MKHHAASGLDEALYNWTGEGPVPPERYRQGWVTIRHVTGEHTHLSVNAWDLFQVCDHWLLFQKEPKGGIPSPLVRYPLATIREWEETFV